MDALRQREKLPNTNLPQKIAKLVKESACYCCQQPLSQEFQQFKPIIGQKFLDTTIDIGPEAFLGPEIFFDPNIYLANPCKSIAQIVFDSIQECPIDCRRRMYSNVFLSGGSTILRGFAERLRSDVQNILNQKKISSKVTVKQHDLQRTAVFSGASLFASLPNY